MNFSQKLAVRDMGLLRYHQAWQLQEELREKRLNNEIPDTLLLLEHPPVYTFGKRDCAEDLLVPREVVERLGIEIVKSNRGGRITYHGPGQLVGYFIASLESVHMNVPQFVRAVEELCQRTLADFGIQGEQDPEYPGVWVKGEKIAAVGLHFSQGISQHGFALNISPNLDHYRHIIACGIRDRRVTAMSQLLATPPQLADVKQRLSSHVDSVFSAVAI